MPSSPASEPHLLTQAEPQVMRLWHGFLSGRVLVAGVLLALQGLNLAVQNHTDTLSWAVCALYLVQTLFTRIARHHAPPQAGLHWLPIIGIDIAVVCLLQLLQASPMNYTPLLALPILMAAALGTLLLAFATTACVTLLMLGWTSWLGLRGLPNLTQQYFQTALTCAGYFLMAYLTHQMAQRLRREQHLSAQSRQAAYLLEQLNHLIIHHLDDGVLAMDRQGRVHTANPAALQLLHCQASLPLPFSLADTSGNAPLSALVARTFESNTALTADMDLAPAGHNPVGLHARTWLTRPLDGQAPHGPLTDQWCVVFLHDLREMQARLRTEKLAAMGRMSAAVAHEIRNPLAAISQANALLAEELTAPGQQRLSQMVAHNAQRLARIAEDVLDIARVQRQESQAAQAIALPLDEQVAAIWEEWRSAAEASTQPPRQAKVQLQAPDALVTFDAEHLRRVLVNLLDNAQRFRSSAADGLQLHTGHGGLGDYSAHALDPAPTQGHQVWLQVWSDGAPLDASVQRHLFEPFFSSHSRSTGLGLYICRELCERYAARLLYQRLARDTARGTIEGNAFTLVFYPNAVLGTPLRSLDTVVV